MKRKRPKNRELIEAVNNASFMASVLVFTVLLLGSIYFSELLPMMRLGNVFMHGYRYSAFRNVMAGPVLLFAVPILCTFPYTTAFLGEKESGEIHFFLTRTTKWRYTLRKLRAVALSGGLVPVAGIALSFFVVFFIVGGMEQPQIPQTISEDSYGIVAPAVQAVDWTVTLRMDIGVMTLRFFLFGAFWALIGAFSATVFRSRFMAYATPFVFYYLMIILAERYVRDFFLLDPRNWVLGTGYWPGGGWGVLLFFIEIILLASVLFGYSIWRRLSDG